MRSGKRLRSKRVVELRPFDASRYLETEEDILYYLEDAMEGNDPKHIASALGDVARSKGMTEIAKKAGLGRQALYAALSENGNPTLETLTAVLGALGLELTVQKRAA
ncbi:putative addiction module antidote protein [Leptolyngbya sp. 15MV]|nr:putative addiction module antidote protein [Leptolyngbya sp. 15MV]